MIVVLATMASRMVRTMLQLTMACAGFMLSPAFAKLSVKVKLYLFVADWEIESVGVDAMTKRLEHVVDNVLAL